MHKSDRLKAKETYSNGLKSGQIETGFNFGGGADVKVNTKPYKYQYHSSDSEREDPEWRKGGKIQPDKRAFNEKSERDRQNRLAKELEQR